MRHYIKALIVLATLSSCDHKNGNGMDDNQNGHNGFGTRDSAITSVIQSLPQIFNEGQRKLYGLSESDMKALAPGKDIVVRHVTYEAILSALDSSFSAMLPADKNSVAVPLAVNNVPRLFVTLSNDKNKWSIGSVGNRRLLAAFRDAQNMANAELVSIPGLEIELIRFSDTVATRGAMYQPLETNNAAGLLKDARYSDREIMQKLRTYAQVLNRQFGDKLKTGEIDR